MLELTMYNVMKHYGENFILNNAGFTVYEGDRVGIVGANGSGKSTILKILAGIEPMDIDYRKICEGRSRILMPKGTTIAYLEQLPEFSENSAVIDILNLAFQDLIDLEEGLKELEIKMAHLEGAQLESTLKRYSQLQQEYDSKGGYDRNEKLNKVCTGLKFDAEFLQKQFCVLSGGEKTTVNLAKILLEKPEILLLDEPTNHLDMDSVEWLEKYLKSYKGIVIIVSHDRYFLDNVVTKIVEVENRQCETYKGNYSEYVKQKEEDMLIQFENYKEQKKKINAMENAIKDLRDWAQRADNNKFFRRAFSMQRKLDKMERIERPDFERKSIKINFKGSERSGFEIIKVSELTKQFGSRLILDNIELYVTLGERVALIGPNGSGKTSFLKMLLGEMNPDKGKIILGANAKIAYLPQIITFDDEELTVINCFRDDKIITEGKAREYLSKFMFFGRDPYKKVKHLSGGEKVRLKLASLLFQEINVLILDEPTNHLDIDSIEVLEEALEDFKGTIFFISHDRYFINKVCSRLVAVEGNKLVNYEGNYDFYRNKISERLLHSEETIAAKKPVAIRNTAAPKTREQDFSGKRNTMELSKLEERIKQIEEEVKELDKAMSLPGVDHLELNQLFSKREELSQQLDGLLEEWVDTQGCKK